MATPAPNTLGIVIPTRWEAREILKRLPFRPGRGGLWRASVDHRVIYLKISGVGRAAAAAAADHLVADGALELISMGFCGALTPELHVGDLVTDRLVTVDRPATTPAERLALAKHANAVAVDMETRAVVETGTRQGVPIRVLRVVSDEISDDLTPLFGADGKFSVLRIAWHLLDPRAWPVAARLRRQSQMARARLASVLAQYLQRPS